MNLDDALQWTGCAVSVDGQCTTSVERLPDEQYLLMTRRGVCILQCMQVKHDDLEKRYSGQHWTPARVIFVQTVQERMLMIGD